METACLRIKFTPLLQETDKLNSTYCLEIVPEVSHLKNLDKLTWKKETNYIEYTVPIIYKIILKKQNTATNTDNNTVKTYYSCIDLLPSASYSNYDLGSGDVSRIISEPFILTKIPEKITNDKIFINNIFDDINDVTKSNDPAYGIITENDYNDYKHWIFKETKDRVQDADIKQSEAHLYNTDIVVDKFTNTESIFTLRTSETNYDYLNNSKRGVDFKNTLKNSSLISGNQKDTPPRLSENIKSQAVICHIRNSQRDFLPMKGVQNNVFNMFEPCEMFSKLDDISKNTSKKLFINSNKKDSPAIRIAQYVQYMETELLPLKIFLDNLITKCSILGVNRRYKLSRTNMLLYKSVSSCKELSEISVKSISNRAVYSIVSDD